MRVNGRTVRIGDVVTPRTIEEAYYSRYGGNPACFLRPGEEAVVASVDVPAVHTSRMFICADFHKYGKTWRVGLFKGDFRVVRRVEDTDGEQPA